MQKYIAVVNPKMDEDEISQLIRKGVAGALFEISHQNYPVAMRLIDLVKKLAAKYNKHISLIQDVSGMEDPLDLHVGARGGVHWVATDKPEHVKMIRGLNKLAGVIYKNRNLPKGVRVDSVMAEDFLDPDAQLANGLGVKHIIVDHANQGMLDSIMHIATSAHAKAIALADMDLAKALSQRRPQVKIIFAAKNPHQAAKSAIYWGVHPVFQSDDSKSVIRNSQILKKGDRLADATNIKHIAIQTV